MEEAHLLPRCRPPPNLVPWFAPPLDPTQVEEAYPLPKSLDDLLHFRWAGSVGWGRLTPGSRRMLAAEAAAGASPALSPCLPAFLPAACLPPACRAPRSGMPPKPAARAACAACAPARLPRSVMPQDHLNYAATWATLSAASLTLAVKAIRQGVRPR